jgi:SAM-dependent methyltransferase
MRLLVGPTDEALFDNPGRGLVFPEIPAEAYDSVLDFGCGCGRLARQLIQQRPRPRAYLGIDLHGGMVRWCRDHLAPRAPGFRFEHHDVWNAAFNPQGARATAPFPAADRSASLVIAWSVFTHLVEAHVPYYLSEVARVLREDGYVQSTWFLFDKTGFPMMQEFQNALYINIDDPTNAVIFDWGWLRAALAAVGLKVVSASPPTTRGFQWLLLLARRSHPRPEVDLPEDRAAPGLRRPPVPPPGAAQG